jgi:hypothetical protein
MYSTDMKKPFLGIVVRPGDAPPAGGDAIIHRNSARYPYNLSYRGGLQSLVHAPFRHSRAGL